MKKLIQLLFLILISIGTLAQNPLKGTFTKRVEDKKVSAKPQVQTTQSLVDTKNWETTNSGRSVGNYQVDLWESFETTDYPEFWTATNEEWMFESYDGYPATPIIDGARFILLFGDWDVSIDTLITPILDIQNGDEISFYLGQWESGATGGNREPVELLYGPSRNGPWTYLTEIDVSSQDMWDILQHTVDVSAAQGQNFLAFACEGYFIMDLVEGPARYYYDNDLMAISLLGNSAPRENTPADYNFLVKNVTNTLVAGSDYTVKLMQSPDTELASIAGVDLDIWAENTFTFNVTFPTPDVTEEIYAVIECVSDANQANNESNSITVNVISNEYVDQYIGDPETDWANAYIPFQTQYDFYSYSEVIYWKELLDYPAGEIIGLDYEFVMADETEDVPITIWMAEIDYDCFNYRVYDGPDLLTADNMYQVFDGVINVNEITGHIYFHLDNPYTYKGEGNLVVLIRGLSNGPENEWIFWKSTIIGLCDDNGAAAASWAYHWWDEIDPTDISNYHWPFGHWDVIPNGTFVMNSELGGLTGFVEDSNGDAIEGVKIEVEGTNLFTYTEADGSYVLPKILHGDQNIIASRYGYNDGEQIVTIVTANTSNLNFTLTAAQNINISGQLVKAHNQSAVEGATISLTYNDYSNNVLTTTSSSDGNFTVDVADNNDYLLEIFAIGYAPYFDTVEVSTTNINLGIIQLTESFSNVFNVVSSSTVDSAIISWLLPDTELQDTIVLDDDNGDGGHGFIANTEGWTGNLFEMEGLHTITGVQWEVFGPASDTCTEYMTIDIFTPNGDLLHEGLPVYSVGARWNTYMLNDPVTIDGDFFVMMHSHASQNTQGFITRWDWEGESGNYTDVIYNYNPNWPEDNGFIWVYEYNQSDGIGCLMIRPIIAEEEVVTSVREGRTISGYNIYKGETSDIPNAVNWSVLNSSPVNTPEYIDLTWPPADSTSMIYAVETIYAEGNSEYCFSTALQLGVPMFISEPVVQVYAGTDYIYDVEAIETNDNGLSITADLLPDGLTIVDNGDGTALLSGIIEEEGNYDVILVASNGVYEDTQEFTIVVETSLIPVIISEPDTLVAEKEDYLYEVVVYYGGTGNVTIEEGADFPDWLTLIDNGDLTATLTGNTDQIGDYLVELITTDGTYISSQEFILTVGAVPVFISEPVTVIELGEPYTYEIEVDYSGTEACVISAQSTLPQWLFLTDNGDNTATLQGVPDEFEAYEIELLAQGEYFSDVQIFTIDVTVGLNESFLEQVNIYPNPTRQNITINNIKDAEIVIYNNVGELILKINNTNQSEVIDLSGNPNGIYFLKILMNNTVIAKKISLIR